MITVAIIASAVVSLSERCQREANNWCHSDTRCATTIGDRNLTALNTPNGWSCVSMSRPSLSCNRTLELKQLMESCEGTDTEFVEVFTPYEGGYPCIRIPAIIQMPQVNKLVAFAECRNWTGDGCEPTPPPGYAEVGNSNRDLCSKYSEDGGTTWSSLAVLFRASQQPTPVYSERYNMGVLQFVNRTDNLVYQSTSTDGITWSLPQRVSVPSSQVGPGPGLELSDGSFVFIGHNGYYEYDSVWTGGLDPSQYVLSQNSTTTLLGMNEASITQLPSGKLVANMRTNKCHCRGVSTSQDGGKTWSPTVFDTTLVDPVNQGSIVTNIDEAVLFVNSASPTARVNGTLYVGAETEETSNPITWTNKIEVWKGAFAYSCLTTVGRAHYVGLLWETNGPQCVNITDASCRTVYSLLKY